MYTPRHAKPRRSRTAVRALFTVGVGAGLAVTGAGTAMAAGGEYTVKSGDTLSEIAAANDTSWRELASINGLANPNLILVGQRIDLSGTPRKAVKQDRREDRENTRSERSARSERTTKSEKSTKRTARPSRTSGSSNLSGAWKKVAQCESGGNPRAVNPAGYYGLFQFDRQTWRSVGGSGNPADASASEQYARAKTLYAQRGASPWPNCGRYLR